VGKGILCYEFHDSFALMLYRSYEHGLDGFGMVNLMLILYYIK